MEFCPECGNLMNPEEKEGVVFLVCSSCGHEEKQDESSEDSYKYVEETEGGDRGAPPSHRFSAGSTPTRGNDPAT